MSRKQLVIGAVLLSVLVLIGSEALADTNNLNIGARPQGLGGAFTAISDDAHASYWNPAGLTRLSKSEFAYTHWYMSEIENVGVDFLALALPLKFGAIKSAFSFSWVRVGAELEQGEEGSTSDMADSRFSLSGAIAVTQLFSVGLTVNRIQVASNDEAGAGVALDAGVLVKPFKRYAMYLAATGKNLASDVKNEELDESWRFGTSWGFWQNNITVAFDVNVRKDINGHDGYSALYFAGGEVAPIEQLRLRFGGGSESQLGYGVGVVHRGFMLDYALATDNDVLGTSHRISFSYRFGGPLTTESEPVNPEQ